MIGKAVKVLSILIYSVITYFSLIVFVTAQESPPKYYYDLPESSIYGSGGGISAADEAEGTAWWWLLPLLLIPAAFYYVSKRNFRLQSEEAHLVPRFSDSQKYSSGGYALSGIKGGQRGKVKSKTANSHQPSKP